MTSSVVSSTKDAYSLAKMTLKVDVGVWLEPLIECSCFFESIKFPCRSRSCAPILFMGCIMSHHVDA